MQPPIVKADGFPHLRWIGLRLEVKKSNGRRVPDIAAVSPEPQAEVGVFEIALNVAGLEPTELVEECPRHHETGTSDRRDPTRTIRCRKILRNSLEIMRIHPGSPIDRTLEVHPCVLKRPVFEEKL